MTQSLVKRFRLWKISILVMGVVSVLTVASFFGKVDWLFDNVSSFRPQYFVLLTLLTLVYLVVKKYCYALFSGFFALVNLFLIVPLDFGGRPPVGATQSYRMAMVNLWSKNLDYDRVNSFIREVDADILLLMDYNPSWAQILKKGLAVFQYSTEPYWKLGWGIGLFSKIPLESHPVPRVGHFPVPMVEADLKNGLKPIRIIGVHLVDPSSKIRANLRNQQLSALADYIKGEKRPMILAGDFNLTPWSIYFKEFIRTAGLVDFRRGSGIRPTWPTYFPPMLIPLDQFLMSPGIVVQSSVVGEGIGSDHYPLIIEFSLNT